MRVVTCPPDFPCSLAWKSAGLQAAGLESSPPVASDLSASCNLPVHTSRVSRCVPLHWCLFELEPVDLDLHTAETRAVVSRPTRGMASSKPRAGELRRARPVPAPQQLFQGARAGWGGEGEAGNATPLGSVKPRCLGLSPQASEETASETRAGCSGRKVLVRRPFSGRFWKIIAQPPCSFDALL
ncbi:uncharacterized protein VTP21DRAFT_10613 [Calcarisporiella thermophila]|uniref:uncharacterized protein n=1 Tax=Calcarisporiella thermophila TaxID=911321 RepID=UPI003741F816